MQTELPPLAFVEAVTPELIELIRQQQRKRQLTIILVTHNREIASLADRPFLLVDGKLADISLSHESSG